MRVGLLAKCWPCALRLTRAAQLVAGDDDIANPEATSDILRRLRGRALAKATTVATRAPLRNGGSLNQLITNVVTAPARVSVNDSNELLNKAIMFPVRLKIDLPEEN